MVGRAELLNAVALNASLFNASRVVGPAVAGVLIAAFGVGVCFAINAVTFLAVLAGLLLMRPEELFPLVRGPEPPTLMRGVREGFAWVLASREARLVLTIVAVVSTVGFNFHVILPLSPPTRSMRGRRCSGSCPAASARARSSGRCSRRRSAARAGRCCSPA